MLVALGSLNSLKDHLSIFDDRNYPRCWSLLPSRDIFPITIIAIVTFVIVTCCWVRPPTNSPQSHLPPDFEVFPLYLDRLAFETSCKYDYDYDDVIIMIDYANGGYFECKPLRHSLHHFLMVLCCFDDGSDDDDLGGFSERIVWNWEAPKSGFQWKDWTNR